MGFSVIVCVTQAKPSYLNFASRISLSPGYYPLLNFDPPLIRICNSDLLQLAFVTADPDLQSGSHTISICNAFGPPVRLSVKTPAKGGQFYAPVSKPAATLTYYPLLQTLNLTILSVVFFLICALMICNTSGLSLQRMIQDLMLS